MAEEKKEKTPFDVIKKALPPEEDIKRMMPAPPPYPPVPSVLLDKVMGIKTEKAEKPKE